MGKPKFEYRMRVEYEGGVTPEARVDTTHLGTEERAARRLFEERRARMVAARTGEGNGLYGDPDTPVRVVLEARKIIEWVEMDDSTPEYERGEDE